MNREMEKRREVVGPIQRREGNQDKTKGRGQRTEGCELMSLGRLSTGKTSVDRVCIHGRMKRTVAEIQARRRYHLYAEVVHVDDILSYRDALNDNGESNDVVFNLVSV